MKNTLRKIWGLCLTVILLVSMTGCGGSTASKEAQLKLAIVCSSAGQNDNGYNQSAVEGAKKIAEELGIEYKIVEPTNGVPAALETLASDGYNVIFNLEYDFEALISGVGGSKPIAEMYPEVTFIAVNDNPNQDEQGNPIHKNVISVLFDVHEASFVAGALSVQVNENAEVLFGNERHKFTPADNGGRGIGFIGGTNSNGITVFSYGFIQGINQAAKDLGVNYDYYAKYDAGFADPATGSTVAGTYYNQGANVVFAVAGSVGDGTASKAKEAGKLAIQVDANKDSQQPGYILTSVIKNTEVPVMDITKAVAEGKIAEKGNVLSYSLASGATSVTDLSVITEAMQKTEEATAKWEEIKSYIADLEEKIANQTIVVVNAQEGETFDPATCPNVTMK